MTPDDWRLVGMVAVGLLGAFTAKPGALSFLACLGIAAAAAGALVLSLAYSL